MGSPLRATRFILVGSGARVTVAYSKNRPAINVERQSGVKPIARRFVLSPWNHQHEVGGSLTRPLSFPRFARAGGKSGTRGRKARGGWGGWGRPPYRTPRTPTGRLSNAANSSARLGMPQSRRTGASPSPNESLLVSRTLTGDGSSHEGNLPQPPN
jgi:hypothetical protein